jgi:predicted metalloendopeptidase
MQQMWCSNMMPDAIKKSLEGSVHSPESVRVKGSLANFNAFAEAFNCAQGNKMNPQNKCILW